MNDLIIAGTGVHAGEMAEIVERINNVAKTWNFLGFITPDPERVGKLYNGYAVLGTKEAVSSFPNAYFVTDNEWPYKKEIPVQRLVSIIDPSCFVSKTAVIGAGCVFYPNCYIGLNARIGDRVFCLAGSIINHDDVVENDVVIASGVKLAGSVYVEEGCYLGQACTVRQLLRIGKGSLLGMGCAVIKDVPPSSVMVGNPARRLRENVR